MKKKIATHHKLAILWVVISMWGIAFIYSATYRLNTSQGIAPYRSIIPHVVFFILLLIFLAVVYSYRRPAYRILKNTAVPQFYFSLAFLAIVIVIKIVATFLGIEGLSRGGAYQVIPILGFDFQPLEFFKITSILFFAALVGKEGRKRTLDELRMPVILIGIGALLILFQVDTGGAMIITMMIWVLAILNGSNVMKILRYSIIAVLILGSLALVGFALSNNASTDGDDYRVNRIQSYIDPWSDPENSGYNIINSALAISNGGLTGTGYLGSTQSSGYLFGGYTDFIFSVISEELGLFGAAFTILMLLYMCKLCFDVARNAHNRFGELYCYGFGLLILIQSFINIGGVTAVIPMTGVTLPFISNGINSYFFLTLGLFYVIIIDIEANYRQRVKKERDEKLFL